MDEIKALIRAALDFLAKGDTNGAVTALQAISKSLGENGPREPLWQFALIMEGKLKKNDHKTGWHKLPEHLLVKRLQCEVIELEVALEYETPDDVAKEAADIANFAMMIADRALMKKAEG